MTCHINFWPLSNFVGASLEVTRTISNNKLYFTWGCSRPEGPETGFLFFFFFFFFQWFWHILKYFNSNHNLPSYSLRCVLVVLFFTPPLARDSLSRSPRACLRLTEKRWKIAPVLQIQASSMKLRVSSFLSFFISKRMVKTNSSVFTYLFIVMCIFWSCCLSFI